MPALNPFLLIFGIMLPSGSQELVQAKLLQKVMNNMIYLNKINTNVSPSSIRLLIKYVTAMEMILSNAHALSRQNVPIPVLINHNCTWQLLSQSTFYDVNISKPLETNLGAIICSFFIYCKDIVLNIQFRQIYERRKVKLCM